MAKQLLMFHNAVSAYFSGNQAALEESVKQFAGKVQVGFLWNYDSSQIFELVVFEFTKVTMKVLSPKMPANENLLAK